MTLSKEICIECVAVEKIRDSAGGWSNPPCPWRSGVDVQQDDDKVWQDGGSVMCPNASSHNKTDSIPVDCLRKSKQRAFFEMALWVENQEVSE
jgi:hypothetical protein